MIDTHCHLQFNAYKNDAEAVYQKCAAKNMLLNVVGSQRDTSARAIEYAQKYERVYATVGLHPVHLHETEVDEGEVGFVTRQEDFDYKIYKELAIQPKVIAIGECGLELFHLPANLDKNEVLAKQKEAFVGQYNLAQELDLPLVIHVREAHSEMIEMLKSLVIARSVATKQSPNIQAKSQGIATLSANRRIARNDTATFTPPLQGGARGGSVVPGVIHCFTGNWAQAQEYLKLGFYIGFTGVITFPAKKTNPQPQIELLETVRNCTLDRILIETDAPYLAPQAYRGARCEPWMVEEVAKEIGKIRALSLAEVIDLTANNAKKLFSKIV